MTRDELNTLIERRLVADAKGPDTSPKVFQVRAEHLQGIGVAHLPPGVDDHPSDPYEGAGIVIVDDREPGMIGPISFDPQTMQKFLRTTTLIAIYSADLIPEIYDWFMNRVAKGSRLLVFLTTENRHDTWRDFVFDQWHGDRFLEVIPVKNDPTRTFATFVTRFDRCR